MLDIPNFAPGEVMGGGDVRAVSYGGDAGLYVEFRMENVHQVHDSEKQGRPIYKQVPFVRCYVPGDKTKIVDRPARLQPMGDIPSDPQRFPRQWQAFQNGQQVAHNGTPLVEWPKVNASQVRDLAGMNIHTVEQLSQVADSSLSGLGHGGRALRDAAILWLERANDTGAITRLQQDHAQEIAALKAQIAAMQNADANAPRRGRPPKGDAE